jgi:hypothetical protein
MKEDKPEESRLSEEAEFVLNLFGPDYDHAQIKDQIVVFPRAFSELSLFSYAKYLGNGNESLGRDRVKAGIDELIADEVKMIILRQVGDAKDYSLTEEGKKYLFEKLRCRFGLSAYC